MKKNRLDRIKKLLRIYEISTQKELTDILIAEGFKVTQTTVSRDVRRLGLIKVPGKGGEQRYVLPESEDGEGGAELDEYTREKYVGLMREAYLRGEAAQNILVIRTVSGMAMAVASVLDALKFPEVAGCIAGDDTVFAATHSGEDARYLLDRINKLLNVREKSPAQDGDA